MKTRFTLREEGEATAAFSVVCDESSINRRTPHEVLLPAFPAIWMREDVFRCWFKGLPKITAFGMPLLNICTSTFVQISQEIGEYVDGCLTPREWGNLLVQMSCGLRLRTEVEFEPVPQR